MTDEEIEQALRCCIENNCSQCPCDKNFDQECVNDKITLEYIERLKDEKQNFIERLKERLSTWLKAIQDKSNYDAMFGYTVEACAIAREQNHVLFEFDGISDEEYCANNRIIEEAKKNMIIYHGQWAARFFEKSKTEHTVQTLVSSVYHDIFGIEIKRE